MLGHFNAIISGCVIHVIHAYMSIRRERNRGHTEKPEILKSRAPSIQSRVVYRVASVITTFLTRHNITQEETSV